MTEKIDYILEGAKGPKAPAPITYSPDSLRSKDSMEVVLAISEGPIFGLEDGQKSFYIGDTPIQNSNGDFNFKTFVLNFFPGNESAAPVVPILGGQSSNQSVNVGLAPNVPVTRQTTTRGINSIDLRLVWTSLYRANSGGTFPADAQYLIEYKKTSSGTWIQAFGGPMTISGKTTSNYVKEVRIILPETTMAEDWDIRVTNLSTPIPNEYFNLVTWESTQETIQEPIAYNNTAIIQLSGEATDQFTALPQWSGIYKGRLIKVPSNYDPVTRVYTGPWDGSWQVAWSDNPAWILYDFVMNESYGIKSYYEAINLDKYDTYEAAQWCDELVPNGKGGTQPRYTFNAIIAEPRSGKEMASYIAGSFGAVFFDDLNGTAYLKVDKDDNARHLFTKENVLAGNFTYNYTDIISRFNDFTVTFVNPELSWEEDRRRVFDQDLIDQNGRIPYDYIAVGCTNEHEALRKTWLRLITSNTENCIVQFATNRLGSLIKPFDVILISDSDMGYGISGRIKEISVDRKTITLRTPIYLEAGIVYEIQIKLGDGSHLKVPLINTTAGYNTTLFVYNALPENIPDRAVFSIEADGVIGLPRPFRVTKVEEQEGDPDMFSVEAININRNKWYDSDNIVSSGEIKYSALPSPFDPPGPTSCSFNETFIKTSKEFHIEVSPVFNRGAYKYYANDHSFDVWSRRSGTNDVYQKRELRFGDTLINHPSGTHDFKILGRSSLGKVTRLETAPVFQFDVTNPKEPPAPIDWIKINKREVYWGYATPPDDFEGFEVRYHNEANRTTWDDANKAHQGLISSTSFYTQLIPSSARVIMVRARDFFGIYSETSAIIYRDAVDTLLTNEVDRFSFFPAWTGTKTNCTIQVGTNYLTANDTGTNVYSGVGTAFMYDGGLMYDAVYNEMTFQGQFTSTSPGDLLIEIDFDGSGYEVTYKLSSDSNWLPVPERQQIPAGTYDVKLRVLGGPTRGVVRSFDVIVDAEDIIEDVVNQTITVGASGIRLPLTKNYTTIKVINVAIQDPGGATAVGYRVIDKNPALGPLIKLVDAAGSFCTGTFDATIKGFIG